MGVGEESRRRFANLSVAAVSMMAALHCNVYNDSLLGKSESSAAGSATLLSGRTGMPQASSGSGGSGGELLPSAGAVDGGGFGEMAGAAETGGTETGGASGGTAVGGETTNGGAGGTIAGSGGAGASNAGSSAVAGGAGGSPTAMGCAKLSVPLDAANDKAHFVITLASNADLSGATIDMRFYAPGAKGGTIFNYVQDAGTFHFLGVPVANRHPLSGSSWSTISWNVGKELDSANTGIVKTNIKSIGIEINAQPSTSWLNPTIVYVDSITVQNPALSFTFSASSSVSTSNDSGALWLNVNAADTTASGSAVTWQATCP